MKPMLSIAVLLALAGGLVGCGPYPTVDFDTPRVCVYFEATINSIEPLHGSPRIEKLDPNGMCWKVSGEGKVVIRGNDVVNDTHVVEIMPDCIRVHGVNVRREDAVVFIKARAIDAGGVHVGKTHE